MTGIGSTLRRPLNPIVAGLVSAVVLIGILAVMIESRASILRDGTEVILRAEPVDPRDLMRGDYVELQFRDVSSVEQRLVEGDWPPEDTIAPVWLILAPGSDGVFVARAASFFPPENIAEDEVVLKSLPTDIGVARPSGGLNSIGRLRFGIERYYVPEGEGLEIESARNEGRTSVAIRVSTAGVAQIARLMIDGETLYQEPLY